MHNRLRLVAIVLFVLLVDCAFAKTKAVTTNDVDRIFNGIDVFSIRHLGQKCQDAGLGSVDGCQTAIRRYAFDRLLSIPVWTNAVRAAYLLTFKSEWIKDSERVLGMRLEDADLRKILESIVMVQPVSTNDLADIRKEAVQLDCQREPWRRGIVNSANPGRHFIRWRNLDRKVHEWNTSVADYRQRLVEFVCRKYDKLHTDVPEKERREALKAFLLEYGFSLPDPVSLKVADDDERAVDI